MPGEIQREYKGFTRVLVDGQPHKSTAMVSGDIRVPDIWSTHHGDETRLLVGTEVRFDRAQSLQYGVFAQQFVVLVWLSLAA